MKSKLLLLIIVCFLFSCEKYTNSILVSNVSELNKAIENSKPGDHIVLKNGTYANAEIKFYANGKKFKPIVLKAETPGKVFIEGKSNLTIGGNYLVVRDLYFRNGYTPTKYVIRFKVNNDKVAFNCKVTNCVIDEFTQLDRDKTDHWVEFWGQNNELSNSYIAGKSNFGPTIMVALKGNQHINNHHQIINNHFGPRPRKGGPHGETMQIGDSSTSMAPSYTNVENNFFERCNGEVEIISSKSNFNRFKNNVFFESEGSLVLRHGNYANIDGNVFIGNDNSRFIGGIRVINTGHWITNNYFYKLKGSEFRAPIAVMNGIPKSPLNRYNQVTDVVVAYNSWVDCPKPWFFSVGSNVSQSDVLPKSEIRSARPIRTIFANNSIYNSRKSEYPIHNYDKVDGISFQNNITNYENKSKVTSPGISKYDFSLKKVSENFFVSRENDVEVYEGFDFNNIKTDLLGTSRSANNSVGAIVNPIAENTVLIKRDTYGASWFSKNNDTVVHKNHIVASSDELVLAIKKANSGDTISLKSLRYEINASLIINKEISLKSTDNNQKSTIHFTSEKTAFRLLPKAKLRLENVIIEGNKTQNAFMTLDKNMSKAYDLFIKNSEVSNFKNVLEVSKGSFADTIFVANATFKNNISGFNLNKETNNKGDYNSEFITIRNSTFENISETIIDYHRGGYDESTIGGNLVFENNTVTNSGKTSENKILIKNRGIVNLELKDNTFKNNTVKTIAILWGEKGQKPLNNVIENSGEIKVVQNLKLELMY